MNTLLWCCWPSQILRRLVRVHSKAGQKYFQMGSSKARLIAPFCRGLEVSFFQCQLYTPAGGGLTSELVKECQISLFDLLDLPLRFSPARGKYRSLVHKVVIPHWNLWGPMLQSVLE